jgi:hypothetical protein
LNGIPLEILFAADSDFPADEPAQCFNIRHKPVIIACPKTQRYCWRTSVGDQSRPALAMDALQKQNDGSFAIQTDPDPKTGATVLILDPLGKENQ